MFPFLELLQKHSVASGGQDVLNFAINKLNMTSRHFNFCYWFLYVQMVATNHNCARSDQSRLSHQHAGYADSQSQGIVNIKPLMNTDIHCPCNRL